MNRLKYIIVALALLVVGAGCTVTRNTTFSPEMTSLELHLSDMEYIGETEISIEYRTYLGFIRAIDSINGIPYDGKEIKRAELRGRCLGGLFVSDGVLVKRASYKVYEDYPDATNFMVVREQRHKVGLFLGAEITSKALVRAYRLKK